MCLTIGFRVGCLALFRDICLFDTTARVDRSSRGFRVVSCSGNSREASLAVLGLEVEVFWRAVIGRFFLTPVMLLRFAYSLLVTN